MARQLKEVDQPVGRVSALYDHPIKSCAARRVSVLRLDGLGPVHDRRWMLIDARGDFVSQRTQPQLCLVHAVPVSGGLQVKTAGRAPLFAATPTEEGRTLRVQVWGDTCSALDAGNEAAMWFSDLLGLDTRLVRQGAAHDRAIDPRYSSGQVAYADGFPLLVTTAAAIQEIAERGRRPPDARRFRPNIVIAGPRAFAEDRWRRIRVGSLEIDLVKPCSRCGVVNVDPDTGVSSPEQLRELAGWRRMDGKVMVGQNGLHGAAGAVMTGDPVVVLEWARPR